MFKQLGGSKFFNKILATYSYRKPLLILLLGYIHQIWSDMYQIGLIFNIITDDID